MNNTEITTTWGGTMRVILPDGTVVSGWKLGDKIVRDGVTFDPVEMPGARFEPESTATPVAKTGVPVTFTGLGQLLNEPEESVDYLVKDRIAFGSVNLLAGKPKAGKSTAARALAFEVARGGSWLGSACLPRPVWYAVLEDKRSEVRRHYRQMGATGKESVRFILRFPWEPQSRARNRNRKIGSRLRFRSTGAGRPARRVGRWCTSAYARTRAYEPESGPEVGCVAVVDAERLTGMVRWLRQFIGGNMAETPETTAIAPSIEYSDQHVMRLQELEAEREVVARKYAEHLSAYRAAAAIEREDPHAKRRADALAEAADADREQLKAVDTAIASERATVAQNEANAARCARAVAEAKARFDPIRERLQIETEILEAAWTTSRELAHLHRELLAGTSDRQFRRLTCDPYFQIKEQVEALQKQVDRIRTVRASLVQTGRKESA